LSGGYSFFVTRAYFGGGVAELQMWRHYSVYVYAAHHPLCRFDLGRRCRGLPISCSGRRFALGRCWSLAGDGMRSACHVRLWLVGVVSEKPCYSSTPPTTTLHPLIAPRSAEHEMTPSRPGRFPNCRDTLPGRCNSSGRVCGGESCRECWVRYNGPRGIPRELKPTCPVQQNEF
jgi:hypothetical protein